MTGSLEFGTVDEIIDTFVAFFSERRLSLEGPEAEESKIKYAQKDATIDIE